MNNTENKSPVLTNGSTEHIRHLAQQLLDACDASSAPVKIGNRTIKKGSAATTAQSKEVLQRIIANKFHKKYYYP
jgi:hypothetical protein